MKTINQFYIGGKFVAPEGTEHIEIINPANRQLIGTAVLGSEKDAVKAIAAAKAAFPGFAKTSIAERQQYLQQLHDAMINRLEDLTNVTMLEYGATTQRAIWSNKLAADTFLLYKELLNDFEFERKTGNSDLVLTPIGITAIMTAWNSNSGSISVKLAAAIAAGCTVVIKPSEMSYLQSQVLTEAFAQAGLPEGVINVINGRGDVIGPVLSTHVDVAKICFTGSTMVGKIIAKSAVDTMKRLTLELSGKSPNIILNDADWETAIPMAVNICFMNSGQACIAGTRLLVPENRLNETKELVIRTVNSLKVGRPTDSDTNIGPMASQRQYDRIQHYIKSGIESGAELLVGGEGQPEGLTDGYYVKPTVFAAVTSDMLIAREEIFGPVLSILTYRSEEEAVQMANDTEYGLHAYISSSDMDTAVRVANQLDAGRVAINTSSHDPLAPFGGFKMSGVGREGGVYGLEAQLEPKVIMK